MSMKTIKYKKTRLNTAICLRSIKLIQNTQQYFYNKHNVKNINTIKRHLNLDTTYSPLYIPWNMLNLSRQEKRQVVSILKYYSSTNWNYRHNNNKAAQKYLQRFNYRYGKRYAGIFQLKNNNQEKKLKRDRINSIGALYAIHQALHTNNKFSAYRKFKSSLYQLLSKEN